MRSYYGALAAVVVAGALISSGAARSQGQPQIDNLGTRVEMFVDSRNIEKMVDCSLKLHNPIPREVALTLDRPWEGSNSAYFEVFRDGDEIRMYYRGCPRTPGCYEVTCLATSKDGITFTRPDLGIIPYKGSLKTNIVYQGEPSMFGESHNFAPFKDANPDCRPDELYKAVAWQRKKIPGKSDARGLGIWTSPDGIHWKKVSKEPVFMNGGFDSLNVAFWDTNYKCYVCYFRDTYRDKKGVWRTTSSDFVHWSERRAVELGDAVPEHLYTNGICQYPPDPRWYIGLPMRFLKVTDRNKIGLNDRPIDGLSDAIFMSSRNGIDFDRTFMEALVRPGLNRYNWGNAHVNMTPAQGIIQTAPDELSIYWSENYDDVPRIRRGVVRLDGFGSVNAPYAGGEFTMKPIAFSGKNLRINYATSAVGSVRVEIQDAGGKPIDGFALSDCAEIYGDEISRLVTWNGAGDLTKLIGRPVRLRFVMKDADLYSIRFQ